MKKKSIAAILMAVVIMALSLSGCDQQADIVDDTDIVRGNGNRAGCVEGCTCTGCICCGTLPAGSTIPEESEAPILQIESVTETQPPQETAENTTENTKVEEPEQSVTQEQTAPLPDDARTIAELTDGERRARREQQNHFAEARQLLYELPNSKDKTEKINQMDRQILANNAYNFSTRHIVFIGDSVTEGITSAVDLNGNRVSYVTYANSYLHFNRVLNHGMGGRMFSVYGDEELSLAMNFSNVTNVDSDIIVVFAGVNDYLATPENKRFGNIDDKWSTAGYCGAVRLFMKQLQEYYMDRDIFFVTMYNISKNVQCNYSDVEGQLTLNDYMEVQRQLAKEFGFHVIELYDIGFMDCSDQESSDYYLRDGLHPKDNGNIVLGEHIAAELSLYFGQKEVDKE